MVEDGQTVKEIHLLCLLNIKHTQMWLCYSNILCQVGEFDTVFRWKAGLLKMGIEFDLNYEKRIQGMIVKT